jgi:Protein of unknown function (DUF3572)
MVYERGMSKRSAALTSEAAEGIAAQGLAFLAEEPARLARFLDATGLAPDQIREQAGTPEFLAAVLEHLAGDESLLLVFAANTTVAAETVTPALALLQQASRGTPPS